MSGQPLQRMVQAILQSRILIQIYIILERQGQNLGLLIYVLPTWLAQPGMILRVWGVSSMFLVVVVPRHRQAVVLQALAHLLHHTVQAVPVV